MRGGRAEIGRALVTPRHGNLSSQRNLATLSFAEVRAAHRASQQRLRARREVSAVHGRCNSPHYEAAKPPLGTRSNLHAGQQGAASKGLPTNTSWYSKRTQACVEAPTEASRQAQKTFARPPSSHPRIPATLRSPIAYNSEKLLAIARENTGVRTKGRRGQQMQDHVPVALQPSMSAA